MNTTTNRPTWQQMGHPASTPGGLPIRAEAIAAHQARMTTTHGGRAYQMSIMASDTPNLKADLIGRGFDGNCYMGISEPTGKQRKTEHGLFYRTPAGRFECVLAI